MIKLINSCKSCGCTHTHTHTHTYNFKEINKKELYSKRISFVNNVKKYKNSRLDLEEFFTIPFKPSLLFVSINNDKN